ncbi:PIN-like domain-containing protein [Chitinimonas sp. JJ19]|uniref:PIN-like domain-containing protein n=1 Tax=Chitinimonas sp. JJ19 TaxID=3109352 RepID=UPI0030039D9B
MFGTDKADFQENLPEQVSLFNVLDRRTAIESLDALVYALRPSHTATLLGRTAIGLDANVFLRLSGHAKSVDIIDYLSATHSAPLILPGQAIQEFWNNQLQAVDTVTSGLRKKFDSLKADFGKVDKNFGDYAAQIDELLEKFSAEHGHIYEEGTVRKTLALLEMLQKKALVPYAPRLKFREIAAQRKKTKTPPGFKDEGDGDFFIWVDLLTGLQKAKAAGHDFDLAVLISHDQKIDWSRAGIAHPILVAEAKALVGVPFEIWTIEKLASEIANAT